MRKPSFWVPVLAAQHFVVDFTCFLVLMAVPWADIVGPALLPLPFVVYIALAFGCQLPFAWPVDRRPNFPHELVALLILLSGGVAGFFCELLFGSLPGSFLVLLTLLLLGLANAYFHVAAGARVQRLAVRYLDQGIFNFPGALGVGCGTVLALYAETPMIVILAVPVLLLSIGFALVLWYRLPRPETAVSAEAPLLPVLLRGGPSRLLETAQRGRLWRMPGALGLLLFAWVAYFLTELWAPVLIEAADPEPRALFLMLALAAGRFLGGVLADLLGAKNTLRLALVLAVAATLASWLWPGAALVAVGAGQLLVPVLLTLFGSLTPGRAGFGFGLAKNAVATAGCLAWVLPGAPAERWIFVILGALVLLTAGELLLAGRAEERLSKTVWRSIAPEGGVDDAL